jgi:hypothetical protein
VARPTAGATTDVSVRDQDTPGRGLRYAASAATPRPRPAATAGPALAPSEQPRAGAPRRKADPSSVRIAVGIGGFAATAALVAAIVGPAAAGAAGTTPAAAIADAPAQPPVQHVTRIVTIPSTQTPPPRQVVVASPVPAPTPRVVVVTTSQSGRP